MDNFDFVSLAALPEAERMEDGDTLLLIRNGEAYRIGKDKLGGAGGYLLEIADDEITVDENTGEIVVTTPVDDMVAAMTAGSNVTLAVNMRAVFGDSAPETKLYAPLVTLADASIEGEEYAGMYLGMAVLLEAGLLLFTNGKGVPGGTAAMLRALGGA